MLYAMCSPACILSLVITAVVRGEVADVWGWSDDPELSRQKTAQEAPVEFRALPDVRNGNSTPQMNKGADGGREDAWDGGEEEGAGEQADGMDEAKAKKRKSKGRKKV